MRCPRPWRARKATRFPSSVPMTNASDGSPNGAFMRPSRASASPGVVSKPLPPIIPIAAFSVLPARAILLGFALPIRKSPYAQTRFRRANARRCASAQSTPFEYLAHRRKRIRSPLRHRLRKFRQELFPGRAVERSFEQPRLQHFHQPLFPVLDFFLVALFAGGKSLAKFGNGF